MGFLGALGAMKGMGGKMKGIGGKMGGGGGKGKAPGEGGIPAWNKSMLEDPGMPSYQSGTDMVPQTGPAMLHQGEAVIPADENAKRMALMSQLQNIAGSGRQPQMPRLGGDNATLLTGQAVPRVRGIQPSATPPTLPSRDPAAGLKGLPAMVMQTKQKHAMDRMNQARQIAGQYVAMINSGDPKLQQAAQALIADKKNHKIFDKATSDPASPEYQGVQAAYQDVIGQEQQKQQMEQLRAQVAEQQARVQEQRSRAQYYESLGAKAERFGEVTPAEIYKQQEQNERTKTIVQGGLQRTTLSIVNMNSRTQAKITSLEKIAALHEEGSTTRAKMRNSQSQAATAVIKQYKNIQQEIANLDREQKDMQDNLARSPITSYISGAFDDYQSRMAAIESKRSALEGRLQELDASTDAMQQGGVLPAIPAPLTSGATDQPNQPKVHDFTSNK